MLHAVWSMQWNKSPEHIIMRENPYLPVNMFIKDEAHKGRNLYNDQDGFFEDSR